MKIKLIDFGIKESQRPYRPHGNDAGADVYMPYDCTLQPGEIEKIPLGFGIEVPDGYAGYVFPRSSMAVKGLVCELPGRNPRNFKQCKQSSAYHYQRGTDRAACDYAGSDCRLCFRAWSRARHGWIWQHRGITLFSGYFLDSDRDREWINPGGIRVQ